MSFCSSLSFSRNSMYSMHYSYYSVSLSGSMTSLFLLIWMFFTSSTFITFIMFDLFYFSFYFIYFLFVIFFIMFLGLLFMWINDFVLENSFGFTSTEQFSMIYGMKLLMFSEWMLFFACFWGIINFSFMLNAFSLFFCFPLLSSYSFSLPYSNLLVLLFSSLPIQSASIFYKVGLFMGCIEQLGQTMSCGMVFLVLQIKEFFYSYLSISDCIIGSMFYFTTGLHGMHVIFGLLYFFVMLFLLYLI